MPSIRSLALQVPAIRRLVEDRDQLFAELATLRAQIGETEQRAQALGVALAGIPLRQAPPEATSHLAADLAGLRRVHLQLEQETSAMRLAAAQNRLFITDYAYYPSPRPIESKAGGRQIEALFRRHAGSISATLEGISRHVPQLSRIPRNANGPLAPHWDNPWFPPFDGAALYGLIAENKPRRFIEVGSGISTRFARQAVTDLALSTRIISIDPHPHNPVSGLCDETIVARAEDLPDAFWENLAPDDMVFIDNSHRSFPGSDVTVFFAEVLPALPAGVIYGIHDIFLPYDYPAAWNERFYSEQYLLMTYLLGGFGQDKVLLPVNWATGQPDMHGQLSGLWEHSGLFQDLRTHGGAFWAQRGPAVGG